MSEYDELVLKAKQEFVENYAPELVNENVIKVTKKKCRHIDALYMAHREYINNIINKFVHKNPECLEYKEDFYNEGYFLFLRALRTYDPDKRFIRKGVVGRVRFKTHLHNWVNHPFKNKKRDYLHLIDIPQAIVQCNKRILDVKDDWGIDSTVLSQDELELVVLELNQKKKTKNESNYTKDRVAEVHNSYLPLMTMAETTEKHIESIPQQRKRDPNLLLKALLRLKNIIENTDNLTEMFIAKTLGKELYALSNNSNENDEELGLYIQKKVIKTLEANHISKESWQTFVNKFFKWFI